LYVEDLKRGTNKDIGPKDIFEMGSRKDARTSETSIMVFNYSTISTSSISGNSISLDAATKQTMAANKQYIAANATMMSNNLIIVHPPF
jgi:hypothetical protein